MSGRRGACPRVLSFCKYKPPFSDRHHKYWPAPDYQTPLEIEFRTDPRNIQYGICRCMHDLEHCKKPPKKPSISEMKRFLGR